MSNAFSISNLRLSYSASASPILKGLNLQLRAGEFHILLGQNGAGKSSLMRCLAGLQHWSSGQILRNGADRSVDRQMFNDQLTFIAEDIVLPNYPLEMLASIYDEAWGSFDHEVFARIIAYAEIKPKMRYLELSRGQRSLAQFALALASKIQTLLIDEVTATLDPFVRSRLVDELYRFQQAHSATVLVATNIATEFANINANVILLERGAIYLEGPIEQIAKEFVKIEVPYASHTSIEGFVPINSKNSDSVLMIGRKSDLAQTHVPILGANTLEEIFIYLSARRTK